VQGASIYIDRLAPCTKAKTLKAKCFVDKNFICIFEPKIYAEVHRSKVDKKGSKICAYFVTDNKFGKIKALTFKHIRGKVHRPLSPPRKVA